MNTRDCIKTSLAGAALAAVACLPHGAAGEAPATQPAGAAPPRPNIVVIFVDDMGYADVGAFGCRDIPTPNIDALAREGVRFTNAYCTGAWCVPSRAGLLTGCFPGRPPPRGAAPIGQQLTAAGYATMENGRRIVWANSSCSTTGGPTPRRCNRRPPNWRASPPRPAGKHRPRRKRPGEDTA